MEIAPFELERWFDEYEHEADIMLAESGIRSLPAERFDTDPGQLGYVIPTDGDPEFRAEVGERYGRSAEEVCFTCGTQEANYLVFRSLLDPGDHAVVVTPTYQALSAVPESICAVSQVELEAPDWTLDLDAVADAIRPETRLLVLNNPNNPTGKYHSEETVEALYDLAEENDTYLLCDEVYRLLAEESIAPVASLGEYGISTTSLTKAYGLAGLRFGWIAGPKEVIEGAVRWKDYTTISPSVFGQHVAKQALGGQEEAILEENRELAREHHDRVAAWIDEHGLSWHDPVGVNGFVSVPEGFPDGKSFCRAVVEEESVVLAPGEFFGFEEYFRIGFGLNTEALEEGLDRVGRVIERHE
ncbi:aminotransferase class I/II-fold pyridoxal phosphate-dependent enzyme [Halalkalicoccus jeotgali]|uniref:Aminotransferase class I and II n=1 Tax=Halalkalicoccus jeotgali (strain DSM 18796 / CECT 7217 / JCM 14584 / KCTC 4019 / B3) TaxID=795797 RepID=D8JA80_HALJB|nr:aminotransferase class I/II-fold pyridoxal phosphate-dependent enzyme [Halalkalicoccus jeotgali]ADJ14602.1 aminotransferase class I and II [Halalkalicoccus jeotgali B3]ELY39975.1 class I and II aminotransferase [Halalkalicoccus jeotgali B3]